ncbi:hypothetical protein L2E82_01691 [Cichorium intybus]|uniref:Uncharacterized protein n=1 Tax=Cichorium intybus TaxID=13427 RepID=A0ACB9GZL9_CICIN|nr:hypothetical protein L2E82_01691 [Cichorium intybus]
MAAVRFRPTTPSTTIAQHHLTIIASLYSPPLIQTRIQLPTLFDSILGPSKRATQLILYLYASPLLYSDRLEEAAIKIIFLFPPSTPLFLMIWERKASFEKKNANHENMSNLGLCINSKIYKFNPSTFWKIEDDGGMGSLGGDPDLYYRLYL